MDQTPRPTVLETADKLRRAQEKLDGVELERLIRAFAAINDAAVDKAEALALLIAQQYAETGKLPTPNQIERMRRYQDLIATIQRELDDYASFLKVELRTASGISLAAGEKDARILIEAALSDAGVFGIPIRGIEPRQLDKLIGFLDPDGELFARLGKLSEWTAQQVADEIVKGVGLGLNPKTTARMLTRALTDGVTQKLGMALSDALRTMRTVQLWSYREASRANYTANDDVVRGWVWYATLDSETCASCVAMHGTEHPNSEVLDDHYNGRCAPIPLVLGQKNPVALSGERWFRVQNEQVQKDILGPGRLDAWKSGKFGFGELSQQVNDPVYGTMRVETPLKDLIPDETA